MNRGLIHIYCGDGKGKTTAAIGLAVRAAGRGMPVLIAQFLKGRESGELHALAKIPEITLLRGKAGDKFTFQMDERELQQTYDENSKLLLSAVEAARAGDCRLLVLDEIMGALSTGTVDADLLRSFVERRNGGCDHPGAQAEGILHRCRISERPGGLSDRLAGR